MIIDNHKSGSVHRLPPRVEKNIWVHDYSGSENYQTITKVTGKLEITDSVSLPNLEGAFSLEIEGCGEKLDLPNLRTVHYLKITNSKNITIPILSGNNLFVMINNCENVTLPMLSVTGGLTVRSSQNIVLDKLCRVHGCVEERGLCSISIPMLHSMRKLSADNMKSVEQKVYRRIRYGNIDKIPIFLAKYRNSSILSNILKSRLRGG